MSKKLVIFTLLTILVVSLLGMSWYSIEYDEQDSYYCYEVEVKGDLKDYKSEIVAQFTYQENQHAGTVYRVRYEYEGNQVRGVYQGVICNRGQAYFLPVDMK